MMLGLYLLSLPWFLKLFFSSWLSLGLENEAYVTESRKDQMVLQGADKFPHQFRNREVRQV